MVLINFGIDEQGRYLGNTSGINMFDSFNEIWKEFLEDGSITEEEYLRMTLPQYYNTVEEFSHPLVEVDHPVYQSGFRLENILIDKLTRNLRNLILLCQRGSISL